MTPSRIVRFPGDAKIRGSQKNCRVPPGSPSGGLPRGSVMFAVAAAALLATDAHAYIDPGAGSVLLQAAIGAVAAGALLVRTYWERIKRVLSPRSRRPVEPQPSPDARPGQRD